MKIIHFIPLLTKGGGERVAVDLANAAVADGHEVSILVSYPVDESLLAHRLSPKIKVLFILTIPSGRFKRYVSSLSWLWRNWKWLSSQDIFHCHLTQASAIGALIYIVRRLLGGLRPAVIETNHTVGMPIPFWHRKIHGWLCAQHDGIVMMAEEYFWTKFVRDHPKLHSELIPNGVDAIRGKVSRDLQIGYRKSVNIPHYCQVVIGTVSQFRPERRPHVMAEIFARLSRLLPDNVHFLMVGDGVEIEAVRTWIKKEGLESRIHTPGLSKDPRLAMSVMDLYLTLNVGPITGIAALEAVFVGVPVIALQLDKTYQSGSNDWIWSHNELDPLTDRAIKLLLDENACARLVEKQRAYAECHHTIEKMHIAYCQFYARVLSVL